MHQKFLKKLAALILITVFLSSCYTYTSVVGEGAKGNEEITAWNHYVVYGLAPVGVSDSKKMADGAENYTVTTTHTFVNGLIAGLTFGIYTPTTTIVKK